jgi:TonB family protein
MRFLFASFFLLPGTVIHAQHIFGHGAEFTGGPERHEVQGELTVIDVDPPCELVLRITVDRKGKVLDAVVERNPDVCVDTVVVNKALRSARGRVFNADPKAPARQQGLIHWSYRQPERDMTNDVAMPDIVEEDSKVYECATVELAPQFPGGKAALDRYMSISLHYPEDAKAAKQEGTVLISFLVEKDGKLSTFTLEKGVETSLNQEAMRVMMRMPNWNPGLQNGRQVRTRYVLPIIFKLPSVAGVIGEGSGNGPGRGPETHEPIVIALNGRTVVKAPKVDLKPQESGRVVLDIWVDRKGNVLRTELGRGSTTNAKNLVDAAHKAIMATRFSADPKAMEEQQGKATFVFKLE